MGDMDRRRWAASFTEGCRPKDPPMMRGEMGGPFHHPLLHLGGQGGAGQLNSLHAQGAMTLALLGSLARRASPPWPAPPPPGWGVGCSGSRTSGSSVTVSLQKAPRRFLIFRAGGGKMLLFQLAHAEQLDVDHGRTPYKMVRRKVDGRPAAVHRRSDTFRLPDRDGHRGGSQPTLFPLRQSSSGMASSWMSAPSLASFSTMPS